VEISICGSTALCWTLAAFSVSWSFYTVRRTPWTGDQPIARPLSTHGTAQTQNKRRQTSMPRVGFEPMIPVFERAKKVYALDRAATVIDGWRYAFPNLFLERHFSFWDLSFPRWSHSYCGHGVCSDWWISNIRPPARLHGVISQKTTIKIFLACCWFFQIFKF
jgi:hypothetical protein